MTSLCQSTRIRVKANLSHQVSDVDTTMRKFAGDLTPVHSFDTDVVMADAPEIKKPLPKIILKVRKSQDTAPPMKTPRNEEHQAKKTRITLKLNMSRTLKDITPPPEKTPNVKTPKKKYILNDSLSSIQKRILKIYLFVLYTRYGLVLPIEWSKVKESKCSKFSYRVNVILKDKKRGPLGVDVKGDWYETFQGELQDLELKGDIEKIVCDYGFYYDDYHRASGDYFEKTVKVEDDIEFIKMGEKCDRAATLEHVKQTMRDDLANLETIFEMSPECFFNSDARMRRIKFNINKKYKVLFLPRTGVTAGNPTIPRKRVLDIEAEDNALSERVSFFKKEVIVYNPGYRGSIVPRVQIRNRVSRTWLDIRPAPEEKDN